MNLTTLNIDVEQAKAGLDEYRAALRIERNAEDEAIAAGYRAAARGLPIISLRAAIQAGGFFDNRRQDLDTWIAARRAKTQTRYPSAKVISPPPAATTPAAEHHQPCPAGARP